MKTFILAILLFVPSAFADGLYFTATAGQSQVSDVLSIGLGKNILPDFAVEANFINFGNYQQQITPVLDDPTFNPNTGKCATLSCKTKSGTARNRSSGFGLSALLKSSENPDNFMFIRPGLLVSNNIYEVDYSNGTSETKNALETDPYFGFGVSRGHFVFEVTGYPSVYFYSRSLVSVSASYKKKF